MFSPYDQFNQDGVTQQSPAFADNSDQTQRLAELLRNGILQTPNMSGGQSMGNFKDMSAIANKLNTPVINGQFNAGQTGAMANQISPQFQSGPQQYNQLSPKQAAISPQFQSLQGGYKPSSSVDSGWLSAMFK